MLGGWRAFETARTTASLFVLVPLAFSGCREPTQITLTLRTDMPCAQVSETAVSVGSLTNLAQKPPVSSRKGCSNEAGRIGSLVVVPSGGDDEEVAIQVVTTAGGLPANACDPKSPSSSCVVARRALRFVPHTPLQLPIELSSSCLGKVCPDDQTCFDGQCRTAKLPDPEGCTTPGGCTEPPPPSDAGTDAAPDSGADAAPGDLVAWFDFEQTGASVPDLSGNGNLGTPMSASVSPSAGRGGKGGLVMTPPGTFRLAPSASLAAVTQLTGATVAAWIQVKSAPSNSNSLGFIFDHDPFGVDDLEMWVGPSLELCIDAVPAHDYSCSSNVVKLGTWLHVALVANASMMRVYFDGVPTKALTVPLPNFALSQESYFGGIGFDGVMDDIRIYKRVLSDSEIAALAK